MVVTLLFVCFVRSDCSGLFVIGCGDQLRLRSLDGLQCARNREDFRFEVTHGSSPFIWNFRARERQGNFSGSDLVLSCRDRGVSRICNQEKYVRNRLWNAARAPKERGDQLRATIECPGPVGSDQEPTAAGFYRSRSDARQSSLPGGGQRRSYSLASIRGAF